MAWSIGQRCMSLGEPSLGLGIIKEIGGRQLRVMFPAADAIRTYPTAHAPLHRVSFQAGEVITDREGLAMTISEVKEQGGLLYYVEGDRIIPETELAANLSHDHPDQILLAGQLQTPRSYDVRRRAWDVKLSALGTSMRGLVGARIELIPHQLYIAWSVGQRVQPRILLSDEVGMGKTIEAGLIFHQLWVTSQVRRVLVLTPQSLIHQWLVELYRKFNHLFHIMDEAHWNDLKETQGDLNPYEGHQRVIESLDALLEHPERMEAVLEVPWDLVIVDEAHHLAWHSDGVSDAYALVEELSEQCGSMILITATPRQLGVEVHYGLLRLLDPDRFPSLASFEDETRHYAELAALVDRIEKGDLRAIQGELERMFPGDSDLTEALARPTPIARQHIIRSLVDRHGTGRMVFRNRREVLAAMLPQRRPNPVALKSNAAWDKYVQSCSPIQNTGQAQRQLAGPAAVIGGDIKKGVKVKDALPNDPRLKWLISFLKDHPTEKVLLICSSAYVVLWLQEALFPHRQIETAVFHEGMALLERDRQAAYFAKEGGAQILLCSEIGSEGRNFQFAHHLVLYDLPIHPGLLEQRIGRLDRIGQHSEIHIHIPHVPGGLHERLFRWFNEGLGVFSAPSTCADQLHELLAEELAEVVMMKDDEALDQVIRRTSQKIVDLRQKMEKGRDRLLERNSFDPDVAAHILDAIQQSQQDIDLRSFMDALFEIFGVDVQDVDERIQFVQPGTHMFIESFPNLPHEGVQVTYDREVAIAREDMEYLTIDHPIVSGGMDLMLSQDRGIASVGVWKSAPEPGLILQTLFALEVPGSEGTPLERFLPTIAIDLLIDQNMRVRDDIAEILASVTLEKGPASLIRQQRSALNDIFVRLLPVSRAAAKDRALKRQLGFVKQALEQLQDERDRLASLARVNRSIRREEVEAFDEMIEGLQDEAENAILRLDAVRLILMQP
ncbi:MAG: RNA polymerase-associated protein RapA [Acidobacteria bacterium]|nr:RNA polymerase-associated protein RapA [Acidobacteriota bacterium]